MPFELQQQHFHILSTLLVLVKRLIVDYICGSVIQTRKVLEGSFWKVKQRPQSNNLQTQYQFLLKLNALLQSAWKWNILSTDILQNK